MASSTSTYVERIELASEAKATIKRLKAFGVKFVKSRPLSDGKVALTFAINNELSFNGKKGNYETQNR